MLKINDKVVQIDRPELGIGIILGITHDPEALYSIDFPFLRCTRRRHQLEPYKEMKEERNITLTLDKAKEWYKKGGELKEIALQAFTEKELNPLPRSWEEYTDKMAFIRVSTDKLPLSSLPKKYIALYKLEQLRDCWRQGWESDWNDTKQAKYCIIYSQKFKIQVLYETKRFLSFPTIKMAEEFLECFRDLIEKAGDLI